MNWDRMKSLEKWTGTLGIFRNEGMNLVGRIIEERISKDSMGENKWRVIVRVRIYQTNEDTAGWTPNRKGSVFNLEKT